MHECLRGVCRRLVFATRACPSFSPALPLSSLETENRGKEARATLNSSTALDNVCAGGKKCRLRFYDLKTITLHQAPCGGQSLPCPGLSLHARHCSDITASLWPSTMWVLLSPGYQRWENEHPETSCHFPQSHLGRQQPTPANQQRCWDNYLPPHSSPQQGHQMLTYTWRKVPQVGLVWWKWSWDRKWWSQVIISLWETWATFGFQVLVYSCCFHIHTSPSQET